jgi:hypothetical protein
MVSYHSCIWIFYDSRVVGVVHLMLNGLLTSFLEIFHGAMKIPSIMAVSGKALFPWRTKL